MQRLADLYQKMIYPSIKNGLCGFIFTQITDVKTERNGLYTADRKLKDIDADVLKEANAKCLELLKSTIEDKI